MPLINIEEPGWPIITHNQQLNQLIDRLTIIHQPFSSRLVTHGYPHLVSPGLTWSHPSTIRTPGPTDLRSCIDQLAAQVQVTRRRKAHQGRPKKIAEAERMKWRLYGWWKVGERLVKGWRMVGSWLINGQ